jgi:hypothetical protein
MKYEYFGYTPEKNFCVAVVGQTLTTYEFYETRQQAEWALQTGKELLGMLAVNSKHYLLERENTPDNRFRGIWGDEIGMN